MEREEIDEKTKIERRWSRQKRRRSMRSSTRRK